MPAVHPWLMSLRHDILKAKTVARPLPYFASVPAEWMVGEGPEHRIEEKKSWIEWHGGGRLHPLGPASAAAMARIRASKNR
jgi:hypothetical protein